MKTKQTLKKVHFSTGQAMNKNYYNLCLAVLQRAEQDIKGCSVLYWGSKKKDERNRNGAPKCRSFFQQFFYVQSNKRVCFTLQKNGM